MKRGLILSIQGYTQPTTQELAEQAVQAGVSAIRTDQPIKVDVPVIGLRKKFKNPYYITTDLEDILEVASWATYVAIDCRSRQGLVSILDFCIKNAVSVVADVETQEDVVQLLPYKAHPVCFVATTFSSVGTGDQDFSLVEKAVGHGFVVLAEGGIRDHRDVQKALTAGARAVCIGKAVTNIRERIIELRGAGC